MKFPKISQSELNNMLLFGIGISLLLALFAYLHEIKIQEGLEGTSDWHLTTDGNDVALKYKDTPALKLAEDGTIENATINKLVTKIDALETRMDGVTGETGAVGEAGEAGEAGVAGETGTAGAAGATGAAGEKGPQGPEGPQGPKGDPGTIPDMSKYVKQSDLASYVKYGADIKVMSEERGTHLGSGSGAGVYPNTNNAYLSGGKGWLATWNKNSKKRGNDKFKLEKYT